MICVLLLVEGVLLPMNSLAQWKTRWSYEGATGAPHWAELDPDYAACNGGEQSPIDIRDAEMAELRAIRFEYKRGPLKYLINNGYTIRVNYHDAPGGGSFLIAGGKRYQLTQFHFHRPSEEYIRGKPYDMVVHFMHEASDGPIGSATAAAAEDQRRKATYCRHASSMAMRSRAIT